MPIIDTALTGGFRQGEMVVVTGTTHNTVTVKTETSKSDIVLTHQVDHLNADAVAKATGFIVSGHADYALGNVGVFSKRFLDELLQPRHTWKNERRFHRPVKKVVKLHPILTRFSNKKGK